MSNYIRPRIPGASIFFTVKLACRHDTVLVDQVAHLREAVRMTRAERPFTIDAWVVLPDHIHAVWTMPQDDCDYSTRWSVIKARFSRQMPAVVRRTSHERRRERGIWQRRFWEHHLRTEQARSAAVEYCHLNPVKHGLVRRPEDWLISSVHRTNQSHTFAA